MAAELWHTVLSEDHDPLTPVEVFEVAPSRMAWRQFCTCGVWATGSHPEMVNASMEYHWRLEHGRR